MNEAFLKAVPLLTKIEEAGFEAYFVGGAVRDYLLNKPIADVDIATSANPEELKEIFSHTVDVGIEHGTVLVIYKGESYEITSFRTDGEYKDFRRPEEVTFVRSLEEDLSRRDFLINAMALDKSGKLYDPLNGQSSLKERLIQTVGDPDDRFTEDALRMMRALRFNSQLGFQIEGRTFQALVKHGHLLKKIAIERKSLEFEKLLMGENCREAIKHLVKARLNEFLPGLEKREKELLVFSDKVVSGLTNEETWTLLLYNLSLENKSIEKFLREWRLPVKRIKQITKLHFLLLYCLENEWTTYDLYLAGVDDAKSVERLKRIIRKEHNSLSEDLLEKRIKALPIYSQQELAVSGSDLISWTSKAGGPWVKELLGKIEREVVEGSLKNNKDQIKEWLDLCNLK